MNTKIEDVKICVIGLGYVGLPLSLLLAKKYNVTGFDINQARVNQLLDFKDVTNEATEEDLKNTSMKFTCDQQIIKENNVIIVTVPTPIDEYKKPDLTPIISATKTVGKNLSKGSIVVYESTVFPGLTEDICVPILEKESGLNWKKDFNIGYSPERVNPGDKNHTIDKIVKVVSGDTTETKELLLEIYGSVVTAGVHAAPNIKTAEAAKVIENTQRDLNIALMNELSIIFNKLDINTNDVIEAAGTKWNFLKFTPGLVGGHCIGVDPYYLTFKAEAVGHHPEVILSGRRINDNMGKHVAQQTIKNVIKAGKSVQGGKVLIAGFTFKENVPDLRNTKVIDIYNELKEFGVTPIVYDPHVDNKEMDHEYGITSTNDYKNEGPFLGIIIAVKHKEFKEQLSVEKCIELQEGQPVITDLKGMIDRENMNENILYFSL